MRFNQSLVCLHIIITFMMLTFISSFASFTFDLVGNGMQCFHDYYSDQTLITLEASSIEDTEFGIVFKDAKQTVIIEKDYTRRFKESLTTVEGGNHEICFSNRSTSKTEISFELKSGIAAKDYSQVPKADDLQPIEKDLMKLEDFSSSLGSFISYFNTHQSKYETLQQTVVINISYFSIFVIIVMLVLGLLEALISRHIIMSRKLK